MKKLIPLIILICSIALLDSNVMALRVSIEPVFHPYISIGGSANFNVIISEFGDYSAPSLGGFDMDILFNPDILSYNSVVFDAYLGGDPFGQWVSGPNPGATYGEIDFDAIRIQEVSLETTDWLHNNQPDSFILASITFTGINVGHSYIAPDNIDLSDAYGNTIIYDSRGVGRINVIPEPSSFILLLIGLGGIVGIKKKLSYT